MSRVRRSKGSAVKPLSACRLSRMLPSFIHRTADIYLRKAVGKCPHRPSAMTDSILLVAAQLGKAAPERLVEKERIISEAALAARCVEYQSLALAVQHQLPAVRQNTADGGNKARSALPLRACPRAR